MRRRAGLGTTLILGAIGLAAALDGAGRVFFEKTLASTSLAWILALAAGSLALGWLIAMRRGDTLALRIAAGIWLSGAVMLALRVLLSEPRGGPLDAFAQVQVWLALAGVALGGLLVLDGTSTPNSGLRQK